MKDAVPRPQVMPPASKLRIEMDIPAGVIPWFSEGLRLKTEIPVQITNDRSLGEQLSEALRAASEKFRVEIISKERTLGRRR